MNFIDPLEQGTLLGIRLRQLGDIIATLGTLRALKERFPSRRIVFMVDRRFHGLLENVTYIDLLLPEPPKITGLRGLRRFAEYVRRIRRLGVLCVLDFHSNARSALIAFLSGARHRIGFDVRVRKVLYTDVEPRAIRSNGRIVPRTSHEAALALGRRVGVEGLDGAVHSTIPVTEKSLERGRRMIVACGASEAARRAGAVVGLNPGLPYPAKSWPDDYFVRLGKALVGVGKAVVVLHGPGEREKAKSIVERCGSEVHLAPDLALEEVAGFLKHLGVLVTIDSGLKHLAVAVGVPTVTIFGPTSPHEWHMGGERDKYVYAGLSCSPCRLLRCPFGSPCMSVLGPEAVMEEIRAVDRTQVAR